MKIKYFYDLETFTYTYVVYDEESRDAVIIDPVLDFDQASGKVDSKSAEQVIDFVNKENLKVHYILETHAHADHLSSSQYLKQKLKSARVGISQRIKPVQKTFLELFNLPNSELLDRDFDVFFRDDEDIQAGTLKIKVIPSPGHTPACSSYLIEDALFTGDALFMPDSGTGRCDFPNGSARELYNSIQRLYALADDTRVFVGHDYAPNGRASEHLTSIGRSKKENIHLKAQTTLEEFTSLREARDKTLKAPRLLLPSLQVNIVAGHLPKPESNGKSYLKLPMSVTFKESIK